MPTNRLAGRALATLALTFGGSLLLAACGDDDDEPVDAQTPSTEQMDDEMDDQTDEMMDDEADQMDEEP